MNRNHARHGVRRARIVLVTTVVACGVLGITSAEAAAPTNDDFASAQVLTSTTSGGPITGTNVEATIEAGEPLHGGVVGGHSIWYSWVAPDTGPFRFTADGIPGNDTIIAAYTSSATNPTFADLTPVASNDNGSPSAVCIAPSAAGQKYYFAIDGEGGATGSTSLDWAVFTTGAPCPTTTTSLSAAASPVVGDTLIGAAGTWLPATPSLSESWFRCLADSCAPISGATGLSYTVQEDDVGMRLRMIVTASNGSGSFEDASPASGVVGSAVENANGASIAYASNRTGTNRIYISAANGSGSATQMTTAGPGPDTQPNWSTHGDGTVPDRILFNQAGTIGILDASTVDGVTSLNVTGAWPWMRRTGNRLAYDTGSGISLVNSDPSFLNPQVVTSSAGDTHPSISSVGETDTFARSGDIWSISHISGRALPCDVCQLTTTGSNSEPSSSPDGLSIAYVHSGQLWTMDSDGGNQTQIATGGLTAADPAWSPDGTKILFSGNNGTDADIYVVNRSGGSLTDVTPSTPTSNETQPTWQPLAIPPAATFLPAISGSATVGSTLTGSDGVYFNGTLPSTITGSTWVRCDAGGAGCVSTGVTQSTYLVSSADAGATLRYRQTVQNSAGSVDIDSNATAAIPSGGGGGGGGSGGGGGGGTPDLALTWSEKFTQVNVGGVNDITALVTNKGTQSAQQTHLTFTLPSSLQLVGPPAFEVGTGCTGTQAVDCFLDYLAAGATTKVIFEVKATSAGTASITGTLSSTQEANPADNTATVSFQVASPTPPPPPAPRPMAGPSVKRLGTAALVAARHVRTETVDVRFSGNESLRLTATVTPLRSANKLSLLAGTSLAGLKTTRARTSMSSTTKHAGAFTLHLVLARSGLVHGRTYVIHITVVDGKGKRATLTIRFKT